MAIDLNAILVGDTVIITDVSGNRAEGLVIAGRNGELLAVCFSSAVAFARPTRTGRQTAIHGVRVLGHQAQLFPGSVA